MQAARRRGGTSRYRPQGSTRAKVEFKRHEGRSCGVSVMVVEVFVMPCMWVQAGRQPIPLAATLCLGGKDDPYPAALESLAQSVVFVSE